jgi:hypothetical protein
LKIIGHGKPVNNLESYGRFRAEDFEVCTAVDLAGSSSEDEQHEGIDPKLDSPDYVKPTLHLFVREL